MSITMLCPSCSHMLSAPLTAAGKKVKCPKCSGLMLVPEPPEPEPEDDFEVVEEPLVAKRAVRRDDAPVPRSSRREDDDPPRRRRDDDYYDQPRRKPARKKSSGSGNNTLLASLGGGLLTIVVIVVVILKFVKLGDKIANGGNSTTNISTVREGKVDHSKWVQHHTPGWNGPFPGGPPVSDAASLRDMRRQGGSGTAMARRVGNRAYFVLTFNIPGGTPFRPVQEQEAALDVVVAESIGSTGVVLSTSPVGIRKARKVRFTDGGRTTVAVIVATPMHVLMYGVEGDSSLSESDPEVDKFLSEFIVTS